MFRGLDVALNDWLMLEFNCGRETSNYGAYFMPEVVLSSENTPKRSRSVWAHLLNEFRDRWSEKAWKRKPFTEAAQTHMDLTTLDHPSRRNYFIFQYELFEYVVWSLHFFLSFSLWSDFFISFYYYFCIYCLVYVSFSLSFLLSLSFSY